MSHLCLNPRISYKSLVELTKEKLSEYYNANDPFEKAEYDKHLCEIQAFCNRRAVRTGTMSMWGVILKEAKAILGITDRPSMYGNFSRNRYLLSAR